MTSKMTKKETLLKEKENLENKIKKFQTKLEIINQEITNIELLEKSCVADKIIELLKEEKNEVSDVNQLIELLKNGKIKIIKEENVDTNN